MEKTMMGLRSVLRSVRLGSQRVSSVNHHLLRRCYHRAASTILFNHSSSPKVFASFESGSPLSMSLGSTRCYSEEVGHMPTIADPDLHRALKNLMACGWSDLPNSVIKDAKSALSKSTDDEAGKKVVTNVFRAAEAIEDFGAVVMNFKMELDDAVGSSGENTKPLTDVWANAIHTLFSRYNAYLESFGPDEAFLRKKVESELGGKMIFLKMRCKGLGAEWAKVSVIATSGLAGSYVEQRA